MANVVVYSTDYCPYCIRARALLDKKDINYQLIDVAHDDALRQEMMTKSGRHTVPQIFINDTPIGGCDDLFALNESGQLDKLLKEG